MTDSKRKIQVSFDDAAMETIERLQEASGGSSMADVIRTALGFYDWARVQIEEGATVGSMMDGKPVKEVVLPFNMRRPRRSDR